MALCFAEGGNHQLVRECKHWLPASSFSFGFASYSFDS